MLFSALFVSTLLLAPQELSNPYHLFPNDEGASGTLRTYSALSNEHSTFGIQLLGSFFSWDPFIDQSKHSRTRFRMNGNATFDIGIPIEFFAGTMFSFNENANPSGSKSTTSFVEDLHLGLRIGRPLSSWFHLGGWAYGAGFSGTRSARNSSGGISREFGPPLMGAVGIAATISPEAANLAIPFRLNLNLGYRSPNSDLRGVDDFNKFALDAYRYHAAIYAASLEIHLKYFQPFAEFSGEWAIDHKDDSFGANDNRKRFTVGITSSPLEVLKFVLASDIGVGGINASATAGIPRNPIWELFFGASFQAIGNKIWESGAEIYGFVREAATNLPLSDVKVSFVGSPLLPQGSDLRGGYEFNDLEPGSYRLEFEKDGFKSETRSVVIGKGQRLELNIALENAPAELGTLEGLVLDKETHEIVKSAVAQVVGTETKYAGNAAGEFKVPHIPEGAQSVRIEAPGYRSQDFFVQIAPKTTSKQSFSIERAPPATGTCAGTVRNKDGTGLTAVFTNVMDVAAAPFATNPLTGGYAMDLAPGDYEFEVRAENYLPQKVKCLVSQGETSTVDIVLEKPERATLVQNKIVLPDALHFEFGSAKIKSDSFGYLDQVVDVLKKNPDFKLLRVDGHTDYVGSAAYNLKLSNARARSVKKYLVSKGIKPSRVEARGFGKKRPIATNKTEAGRAENRRVEFNLIQK